MFTYSFLANKRKARFLFIASIVMSCMVVGIIILMLSIPIQEIKRQKLWLLIIFVILLMISLLLFFLSNMMQGYCLGYKNIPALVITREGIINNSLNFYGSKHLIVWKEIKDIRYEEKKIRIRYSTVIVKILVVYLYNPKQFIKKHTNPLIRMMLKFNNISYKSPAMIDIDFLDKKIRYESIIQAFEANGHFINNAENLRRLP